MLWYKESKSGWRDGGEEDRLVNKFELSGRPYQGLKENLCSREI